MTRKEAQLNNLLNTSKNILTISGSAIVISATLLKETVIVKNAPSFLTILPLILYMVGWFFLCVSVYLFFAVSEAMHEELHVDIKNSLEADPSQKNRNDFIKPRKKMKAQTKCFIFGIIFVLFGLCSGIYLNSKYPSDHIQKVKIIENNK